MFLDVSVCPQVDCLSTLQVVSQHALQVSRGNGIPACLADLQGGLQAHTQGGSWGVWPWGGLQAHTQGVSRPTPTGGSLGPHPGGSLGPHREGVCIPACTEAGPLPPWTAAAAGGTHPTGMHSCLYCFLFLGKLVAFRLLLWRIPLQKTRNNNSWGITIEDKLARRSSCRWSSCCGSSCCGWK